MSNGRSKNFCFTDFDVSAERIQYISSIESVYTVFGEEVCPSTMRRHLQGFIVFQNQRSTACVRKIFGSAHITIATGTPAANRRYCCKGSQTKGEYDDLGVLGPDYGRDAVIHEQGTLPLSNKERAAGEKAKWTTARIAVEEGRLGDVDDAIGCRHLKSIQYFVEEKKRSLKRKVEALEVDPTCFWFWGPTGTGKSHRVREEYPGAYRKDVNTRQWDDYNDEEVVYYEDVDTSFAMYGGDLKRVADKYPFPIKRIYKATELIRPTTVVVTSNFHPCEIWRDSKMLQPIMRRFVVEKMDTIFRTQGPPHTEG